MKPIAAGLAPEPPFDALVFDCDGTLVDSTAAHCRALQAALRDHGGEIEPGWYESRTGLSAQDVIALVRTDLGYELSAPDDVVVADWARNYLENLDRVREQRIVGDIARYYSGKVPIAVASGSVRGPVLGALGSTGLIDLFDAIVTFEDSPSGRAKPAPDLYIAAAEKLGVAAESCIAYEDTPEGLQSARGAGMRCIDVRPFLV